MIIVDEDEISVSSNKYLNIMIEFNNFMWAVVEILLSIKYTCNYESR